MPQHLVYELGATCYCCDEWHRPIADQHARDLLAADFERHLSAGGYDVNMTTMAGHGPIASVRIFDPCNALLWKSGEGPDQLEALVLAAEAAGVTRS